MSEVRHDSTSSLQRKKPPWLKLDIPVPVSVTVPEESTFVQPVKRQAFLRSVSMPAENTRIPSPPNEVRRPMLQRQTSITQTIRRRVRFERIQTVPIHGHRAGRRPLRKRQSVPRLLFRYQ
uniref:Rhomboid 5 homolog 1 n=1 Tax=Pelusios castaneus TaxID=367368 RepID=A0A8C8VFX6_9SAUR